MVTAALAVGALVLSIGGLVERNIQSRIDDIDKHLVTADKRTDERVIKDEFKIAIEDIHVRQARNEAAIEDVRKAEGVNHRIDIIYGLYQQLNSALLGHVGPGSAK
jgi:acyl-coenzyme A synthetase/AMP-(fatty) acid ligase